MKIKKFNEHASKKLTCKKTYEDYVGDDNMVDKSWRIMLMVLIIWIEWGEHYCCSSGSRYQ